MKLILSLLLTCLLMNNAPAAEPSTFDLQINAANRLLAAGKLPEALAAAKAAAKLDTNRFEAPFMAAVIFVELKQLTPARLALDAALALAPADKKPRLEALKQQLANAAGSAPLTATTTNASAGGGGQLRQPLAVPALSGAARRQYDTMVLIIEEADKAALADERKKLLREFLEKSEPFLKENPDQLPIWTLRAVAAVELNQAKAGWAAGKELKRLRAEDSDDPKLRKVMATIDRKGWLTQEFPHQDYSGLSFEELSKMAAGGDTKAQIALGERFDQKKETQESAIFMFRKAAEAGDSWAMDRLGSALQRKRIGTGSPDPEAIRWLVRAVEQGSVSTALNLAWQMRICPEFPKDDREVVRLLEIALKHVEKGTGHSGDHPLSAVPDMKKEIGLSLANVLATSPDPKVRDGRRALRLALEGQSAPAQYRYRPLEILAAAYAEAGDFDLAVKTARDALASLDANEKHEAGNINKQLNEYKKRKPWRREI